MQTKSKSGFSKNFLWGASSSAHQYEGGNRNQWSVWEEENAKSLATQAPYLYSELGAWDEVKKSAIAPDNYISGKANDHFNLYKKDFDLIEKMNLTAWRFSVEWSRIEPVEGAWSAEALEHYKNYLTELNRLGIEPIVTLLHFTLPVWFSDLGGFEKRANVKYFERFAEKILSEFSGKIRFVITINEPEIYVRESYLLGSWPPQKRSKATANTVLNNLAYAHKKVYDIAHATNRRYKVSIAKNSAYFYPGDDSKLSVRSSQIMQYAADDYFLKKVAKRCDYLGVNYYFSNRVYGYRVHNPHHETSDIGWDLSPEMLQNSLERLHEKYNLPILITENGLADASDDQRRWWLEQTIVAMQKAIKKGVVIEGYLHWSLLDNFEWDKGFWPRFGLFAVDYKTMERTPRPSASWLAKVIKKLRA